MITHFLPAWVDLTFPYHTFSKHELYPVPILQKYLQEILLSTFEMIPLSENFYLYRYIMLECVWSILDSFWWLHENVDFVLKHYFQIQFTLVYDRYIKYVLASFPKLCKLKTFLEYNNSPSNGSFMKTIKKPSSVDLKQALHGSCWVYSWSHMQCSVAITLRVL